MAEENEILDNTITFSLMKYLAYFILILTGFAVTKILGPASFGVYSTMMLILSYGRFSFQTLYSACYKKISFHIGRKETHMTECIRTNTFGPSFFLNLIFAAALFISSYMIQANPPFRMALRITSVLVIIQQFHYFYTIYLRIDKRFAFLGSLELMQSIIRIGMILVLIWTFGVNGVLVGIILSYLLIFAIGLKKHPYRFSLRFNLKSAKELFIFGLPTTFMAVMGTIFTSIDKVMILKYFEMTSLGIYSFAVLVVEVITFIPAAIATVILPSQIERFGAGQDQANIKNIFMMPMLIISHLLPIIIGGALCFSHPVLAYIFPKYLDALTPIWILTAGSYFISLILILENYIVSVNLEKKMLPYKLIFILISILLNYLVIRNSLGLVGIAAATTAVYSMYYLFLASFSLRRFSHSNMHMVNQSAILVLPIVVTAAYFLILHLLGIFFLEPTDIVKDFWIACMKYLGFLLINIPFWLYLDKKTGIARLIMIKIRKMSGFLSAHHRS